MSTFGDIKDGIELAVDLFSVAAKLPVVRDWIAGAVAAQPDHPVSRRIADVMPKISASRRALEELEKAKTEG